MVVYVEYVHNGSLLLLTKSVPFPVFPVRYHLSPSFRPGTLESSLIMHSLFPCTRSEGLNLFNGTSVMLLTSVSFLVLTLIAFVQVFISSCLACYLGSLLIAGHRQMHPILCLPVNLIIPS